ncbi:hypothetical protein [Klebsiella pneumoniae]|uniref:hypothetical protein n=1 Tax=Klebsiella pneumoniae TaxID=573 RepID=UPI00388FC948
MKTLSNALRAKKRRYLKPWHGDGQLTFYLIDPKRKLHVCVNNPTWTVTDRREFEFHIKGYLERPDSLSVKMWL